MGQVIHANFHRSAPVSLTKAQLAAHPAIHRSRRWVEQQQAAGMPSTLDRGKRMYDLEKCLAWLESNRKGAA